MTAVWILLTALLASAGNLEVVFHTPVAAENGALVVQVGDAESTYRLAPRSLPAGATSVTCRGDGIWCPEIPLSGDREHVARLPVFAATTLTGRLSGPGAASVGAGTVQGVVRGEDGRPLAELRTGLSIAERRFEFTAPRGALELRFAFPDAAPVYRWVAGDEWSAGRPLGLPEAWDLGTLILRPGGSLSGWAYGHDEDLPLAGAVVTATLATSGGPAAALRSAQTTSDDRGFFQLRGLEEGHYRVELEAAGRVTEVLEPVAVEAAAETHVGKVSLTPPLRLAVHLDPALHPDGFTWRMVLSPVDRRDDEEPATVMASEEGFAEIGTLRRGRYYLQVQHRPGKALHFATIDLLADETLSVEIPVVAVSGRVRHAGEPVATARVVLEAGSGDRVEVETDADGRLDGWMRRPERAWLMATVTWLEGGERRRRLIEVVPTIEEDLVEIEIDLPARSVYGTVVDGEGRPQPGVRVLATPVDAATRYTGVRVRSDDDGRFHLSGLDAQAYAVQAGGNGGPASELVEVDLSSRFPVGEVRLVLEPTRELSVELTGDGQPVVGAEVSLAGLGRVPISLHAVSDGRGVARFEMPQAVERGVLTMLAPSRLLWSTCARFGDGPLKVALPTTPASTLSLVLLGRLDLPPVLDGRLVVITEAGGFLTQDQLLDWNRRRNAPHRVDVEGTRTTEVIALPGLVPGAYALTWSGEADWQLAERACNAAFSAHDRTVLPPGGEGALSFDTSGVQSRHLQALSGE